MPISVPLEGSHIITYSKYRMSQENVPDFGRVFLMVKYTDITQNTYVQRSTVTEIMAREKCGLLAGPCTNAISSQMLSVFVLECDVMPTDTSSCEWFRMHSQQCYVRVCQFIVLIALRTTITYVRVFCSSI
jgi:hypothetical protein